MNIRNVCVMFARSAAQTALVTYGLAKVCHFTKAFYFDAHAMIAGDLMRQPVFAAFISIVPGTCLFQLYIYMVNHFVLISHARRAISRSVAGSTRAFALILTYWLWVKAVKTGSIAWAALCALAYYFMVRGLFVCLSVLSVLFSFLLRCLLP